METTSFYARRLTPLVLEAMQDTPVVLICGPRQAGKTTLVRQVAGQKIRYLTLDEELTLLAAREDPVGSMVRSLDTAVIDEIQRALELLFTEGAACSAAYANSRAQGTGSIPIQGRRRGAL